MKSDSRKHDKPGLSDGASRSPVSHSNGQDAMSTGTGPRNLEPPDEKRRGSSTWPRVRGPFHLFCALHFWYSCYYDWFYVHVPVDVSSMGKNFGRTNKLKFLTYWDALFCCLAFPISTFVALTFWGLYLVDRELVLPKAVDAYFPTWLNHCMHTNILIFILLEMCLFRRRYPTRRLGLTVLLTFMLAYLAWVHYIFYHTGAWVYPVLHVLGLGMRIVFFVALLLFLTVLYILGERLNAKVWGVEPAQVANTRTVKVN